jgi:hypothetical protein
MSGNLALATAQEDCVRAVVISQPAFPGDCSADGKASVGISYEEMANVVSRSVPIMGLRFQLDQLCPPERFETLQKLLGSRFTAVVITNTPSHNEYQPFPPGAHPVLTSCYRDVKGDPTYEALQGAIHFLHDKLTDK